MLTRALESSARSVTSSVSQKACAICTCNCGRKFRPNGLPTEQKRFSKYRSSPAVRRRQAHMESPVLSQEENSQIAHREKVESKALHNFLAYNQREGHIECDPRKALNFINDFIGFKKNHGLARTAVAAVAERTAFNKLRKENGISAADCETFALLMLHMHNFKDLPDLKDLGKMLLFVLSNGGNVQASMRIMNQALLSNKTRAGTLKSSEIDLARAHLKETASKGEDYLAMVLEGKVSYELGDHERAIRLWTQAMGPAVAASEEEAKMRPEQRAMKKKQSRLTAVSDHTTPWIELTSVYLNRHEYEKARWAVEIGCQQDDPISHYSAALLEKKWNDEAQHIVTSGWLYHMTKAAATRHPKACHELGLFYSTSGWKYIEDEPPDHIKPTAFDSYPPGEADTTSAEPSLWDRLLAAIGLIPRRPRESPKEQLFHTATFPPTAEGRLYLAMEWLHLSAGLTYAPSFLLLARLYLDKTLWAQSTAPAEALTLSDKRYDYASKADCLAQNPINPEPGQQKEEEEEEDTILNPYYSPHEAKVHLRHVFLAHSALHIRRTVMENATANERKNRIPESDADGDNVVNERTLPDWIALNQKVWFRFPEVREMYMDDRKLRLYDDALDLDIYVEARRMCDDQGWDMYSDDGGLLYRHQVQPKKAQVEAAGTVAAGVR